MGYAGPGLRQAAQLVIVEMNPVGIPHVRTHPAQGLHVRQRPHAEPLLDVPLLVLCLAQVGMEPHSQVPGQDGGLPQQLLRYAEGRAGGQGHLTHGEGRGVVERLHRLPAVPEDFVHGLHHAVRRQAAVLDAQVHTAPGGVEADAQLLRSGELGLQQSLRTTPGKDVVVVKAGGTAAFQQLPQAGEGAVVDYLPVQVLPDFIEGLQPVEQLQVLHRRQVPAEGLVEVVVGVDQAGVDDAVGGIDDLLRLLGLRPYSGNYAVFDQQAAVFIDTVLAVAGHNGVGVPNQQARHGVSSFSCAASNSISRNCRKVNKLLFFRRKPSGPGFLSARREFPLAKYT